MFATCIDVDCDECQACPPICYKCEVFADGNPVDTVELGKGGEPCRCKLSIQELSAKPTCDGEHIHVTWDLYDAHGIWKTGVHSSFPARMVKESVKVKCQPVVLPTEKGWS